MTRGRRFGVCARATVADAEHFKQAYFDKGVWPKERPAPLTWDQIPSDYNEQIRRVRRRLKLTQSAFAAHVGATYFACGAYL